MKPPVIFRLPIFLSLLIPSLSFSQVFNLEDYLQFVQSHQNMNTEELLQMHPAGLFVDKINLNPESILYFDSISVKYNLTDYEKSLVTDHGFMVTERLSKKSFGEILLDIHHNDLPVFVSTDAILYAFHASYDRILRDVEIGFLNEKLSNLFTTLRTQMPQLSARYNSQPQMAQMLRDVDVYFTVAAKLIGQNTSPFYSDNAAKIDYLIDKIMTADGFSTDTIFSSNCISYDWSQFKPRGHYDSNNFPQLKKYFRTMMWLGRIEIYLIAPPLGDPFCPPQTFDDITRQCIDAVLVSELFELASAESSYEEIEDVIKFFVGDQDNVTLPNMYYLRDAVSITSASSLLDSLMLVEFQDTLANQTFAAYQLIQSQLLAGTYSPGDSIVPASAFLLFGQRYVDDSYVTAQVVYDRIRYNNQVICRLFPSTLDPLFALGNNASAQLLIPELNQFHYSSNLAVLRYLFDSYSSEYWNSTFYRQWLNAIRTMNPPEDRSGFPAFMTTAAFWQEKLNTQLSSWTELRHDNLLYAKQSYTGIPVCSYPYSYVEPFPELYEVMINIGSAGYNYFQGFNIDPEIKIIILNYFNCLQSISDTLKTISVKELDNIPLSAAEINFLKNMMFEIQTYTGIDYDGWYPKLFYDDKAYEYEKLMGQDYLVADIHTTPSDCDGNIFGWVKHVGTGEVDVGVFIANISGGDDCAFIGPILSYHDYTTENWLRLTDDEWASTFLQSSTRPDWVNIYLADSLGESRGNGPALITSVEKDKDQTIPQSQIVLNNYPNPFNPSTIISFSVPYDLTNSLVELKIYDVTGRLIKTLVNENLSAGNYLTKWEGDNTGGNKVSSGVYIYSIRIGDRSLNKKMTLLK